MIPEARRQWSLLICFGLLLGLMLAPHSGANGPSMEPKAGAFLQGRVIDMSGGQAVVGAWVGAGGTSTLTDQEGRFRLMVAPGVYEVRVEAAGYLGMTLVDQQATIGGQAEILVEMVPENPDPDQASAIDAQVLQLHEAEFPPEEMARGYGLSAVTEVPETIRVLMPDGTVVVMDMDEYLKGVVGSEMPPSWHPEALRAQAVAARSFASVRAAHRHEGADVCTTTHCQVWKPVHYDSTDRAVEDTHGIVARDAQGHIISAFYFAHCDGHTRNSEEVWGNALPYCRSVSCSCGFDFMWGHGVGMCQHGANAMASQGYSYVEILKHYYTGISVTPPSAGQIVQAGLHPTDGDEHTLFTYTLSYRAELDPPAVVNVVIDGRSYALDRVAGSGDDQLEYRFSTQLPPGEHRYHFWVEDGQGHVAHWPTQGSLSGPRVESAATQTPTPTPETGTTRAHSFSLGTVEDWLQGTFEGLRVTEISDGELTLNIDAHEGRYTSEIWRVPFSFIAVGATWLAHLPDGSELNLEVRLSADGITWGPWQPLALAEDGPDRRGLYSSELLLGEGQMLQVRITLRAGAEERPMLRNLRLVCIDAGDSPSSAEWSGAPSATADAAPRIIRRAEWGADESLMSWAPEYRPVRAVVVHHTVFGDEEVDPAAAVRAVYYYHAVIREWGDIGYNYLVDRFGNIYEGRAGGPGVVGGHALQYNYGSIGIALIGNYHERDVPTAMLQGLIRFLAWQCADHFLDPMGQGFFIDKMLPTILGHRDVADTLCPGDRAYALLPMIRQQILAEMVNVPPHVALSFPAAGEHIRAVADLQVRASASTHEVRFYVDGVLRAVDNSAPFTWKWNTVEETEGGHTVRVMALNAAGSDQDECQVMVDNTPPDGTAWLPVWVSLPTVSVRLSSADATVVQFSNDWLWEGEELYHAPGSGTIVEDGEASNGRVWWGQGKLDAPGAWYGPYTCDLPSWKSYEVYFRLKTPDRDGDVGLATLDIADNQTSGSGARTYTLRPLSSADFSRAGVYEEFRLALDYRSQWPTCAAPDARDGLEFRTWFSGVGDLFLDRVIAFGAPQPMAPQVAWALRDVEGPQRLIVRFRDQAGNTHDQELKVGVDRTPPQWFHYGPGSVWVQDRHSGLDTARAEWASSSDGGLTWDPWQPLSLPVPSGTTLGVPLRAPVESGTHVRFRIADRLGHMSESQAIALQSTPVPTLSPTPAVEPTVPTLIAPTPEPTVPTTPQPRLFLPLALRPAP
ncbi:MAG: SpoIID/LytB domain-containing protein [Chloroflexi bacterium]|nr:SpoIID/LytB domain-containing protein [Chloroflexota bacterium]